MVNISELENKEIEAKLKDYHSKGGVLGFSVFKIEPDYKGDLPKDEYLAHLVVARLTIEKENYETNTLYNKIALAHESERFPVQVTDHEILNKSGEKLCLHHFLGPHFDLKLHMPIIQGQLGETKKEAFYYYDIDEKLDKEVDINMLSDDFLDSYPNNKGWFINAFMNPPYGMQIGTSVKQKGKYLTDFMEFFFSDLHKLDIYAWSTDCSMFFDAGKEWWGSYFWTIYNPEKDWYIGIVGSATD